jgi:RHS repeat-associated protein
MKTLRLVVAMLGIALLGIATLSLRASRAAAAGSLNSGALSSASLNPPNDPPNAVDDSYTLHVSGDAFFLSVLANDSDPEGGQLLLSAIVSPPQHGTAQVFTAVKYTPTFGYTGPDSFTYRVCDFQDNCSTASVSLNLVNQTPAANDDLFQIRGLTQVNFIDNDSDADGDTIHIEGYLSFPQHGILSQTGNPRIFSYRPQPLDYTGTDSFVYQVCDGGGACASATVTFLIIGEGENLGSCSCNANVGGPVNVTNGNMYVQQADYALPGAGPSLEVTRTYNSNSERLALFGKGWSTAYDQSLNIYDSDLVRLNLADGRAIYFGRPAGSSVALTPVEKDFHALLMPNGSSGFTLTLKDGSTTDFDAAGKLSSLADRFGNQTILGYSGGKLASLTDPFGRELSFTTNSTGQVLIISDIIGTVATYTYGGAGQLLSVTYADNSAFTFAYNSSLLLTTITDALGNIAESHTYDSSGRAITSEKQGGVEHYGLSYVSATRTDVTDGLGHVTKYTFDTSKGRNVVTSVEGLCSCGGSQVKSWTYDANLNVITKIDALNHSTSYTYDSDGNPLTQTDATGTVTFTYNSFGQVLTRTDQMNGVTTNTYDSAGNLLTMEDALGHTTTLTHDAQGQVLTFTDARGKVTTFNWDTSGRLTAVEDALNSVTNYGYDARARFTSVTNALHETTDRQYDLAGRLKKITHPDASFVLYTYDLAGRTTKVKDARGNENSFGYDGANRLTSVTDALNHVTAYGYDTMSNRTSMTDALSRVTNYDYDDFNRLKKITHPAATIGAPRLFETVSYDAAGNVTARADTAGRVTAYTYDNVNRLTSTTDADNKTTTFQLDALSRTTAVVDALEQEYDFSYDAMGRQTGMTRASVSMSYAYDEMGNRTQRTDYNGVTTAYTYDDINRLTTISYPDSSTATYDYDALSRLTSAVNQNGSVNFVYDNRGRVATTTDVWGQTLASSYDANGNRTALALNSSAYATYAYDEENRLTQLNDSNSLAVTYDYDATNKLTQREFPNGTVFTYSFDGLDRLTHLRHAKGPHAILDNQYSYNTASQIIHNAGATEARAYDYDLVDRLTSVTTDDSLNEEYTYDGVGNRLTSFSNIGDYNYDPFNRLSNVGRKLYGFNDNGNLISGPYPTLAPAPDAWSEYAYDFENRLTQVTLAWRGALFIVHRRYINYKYDALGRRVERSTSDGEVEKFVYDGQDVLEDLNANGEVIRTYLNGPGIDDKIRQTDENGDLYFTSDHLGSTATLTDGNGDELENISYDSFGKSEGSGLTRYTYTGREFDADTGLYYYRARWYDPQIGRFISEDPIGFEGGDINFFTYVANNPVNDSDPSGLQRRAGPTGRGNYHPQSRVRCNPSQDCATLANNMKEIAQALASAYLMDQELGFPRHQAPHSTDIPDWANAFSRCWKIYERKCKGCGPPGSPMAEPSLSRARRPTGPTLEEFRMQELSAREMEMFWKKVLYGSIGGGAVVVAGPPTIGAILQWLAVGGAAATPAYAH